MPGRRDLKQRVASMLELPGDAVLDVPRITIIGDMELMVENHRGVVEYTQDRVVLSAPVGRLAIVGQSLEIATISPDQVIILGRLRGVNYED